MRKSQKSIWHCDYQNFEDKLNLKLAFGSELKKIRNIIGQRVSATSISARVDHFLKYFNGGKALKYNNEEFVVGFSTGSTPRYISLQAFKGFVPIGPKRNIKLFQVICIC